VVGLQEMASRSADVEVPFQKQANKALTVEFKGARCAWSRRGLLTGSLLAVMFGTAIVGTFFNSDHTDSKTTPRRLFQGTEMSTPHFWVEQNMAEVPGVPEAQLNIRMLGAEVGEPPSHVVGHLVTLANPLQRVSLALPPGGCGSRELTTVTARSHHPACRLAINAGYFNVHDGSCIGNVVSHGKVVQTVPRAQGNVNFGIKDGKFFVGYFTPEEIQGFNHMVSGVVWLVRNGKNYVAQGWKEANITVQTSGDKYATNLASRSAVGFDKSGKLIVVQIDGSIAVGANKRGMDMNSLADKLIELGAVQAINLDGGGSSAMAHDGVLINYPSDMKPPSCDPSGLYQCERPVSTILCIHEREGVMVPTAGAVYNAQPVSGGLSVIALIVGGFGALLAGAAFALVARYCLDCSGDDDWERQLSTGSTGSARSVVKGRNQILGLPPIPLLNAGSELTPTSAGLPAPANNN